jgi:hypothetical protein
MPDFEVVVVEDVAALVDQIEAAGPIIVESDDESDVIMPVYEIGGPSHAPMPGMHRNTHMFTICIYVYYLTCLCFEQRQALSYLHASRQS